MIRASFRRVILVVFAIGIAACEKASEPVEEPVDAAAG